MQDCHNVINNCSLHNFRTKHKKHTVVIKNNFNFRTQSNFSLDFEVVYPSGLSLSDSSGVFGLSYPTLDIIVTQPRIVVATRQFDPPVTVTVINANTGQPLTATTQVGKI